MVFMNMCVPPTFVRTHLQLLINAAAENHRNYTSHAYKYSLAGMSPPAFYDMERQKPTKKKNFTDMEIETITREVERHKLILFGSKKSGIKGGQKNKIWQEITKLVNSVGPVKRTPEEVS